jgi:hypothetical protein
MLPSNPHVVATRARHLAVGGAALAVAVLSVAPGPAHAEFQVRSPIVEYRECELEHNGSTTFDKRKSGLSNDQSYTTEIGCGVTPFWRLELEGELNAPSGTNLKYTATTLENMFQLTPQGEYWVDLGFFLEYSQSADRSQPNSITFGPVVAKEGPGFAGADSLHTLNLFFSKDLGHNRSDDTGFAAAWQSRLRLNRYFEPGIELYTDITDLEKPGKFAEQQHRIGPMFAGAIGPELLGDGLGKIKYELGYLFGVTRSTENGAIRWRLEYELSF